MNRSKPTPNLTITPQLESACAQMGLTLADVAKYGPQNRAWARTSVVPPRLASVFRTRFIGEAPRGDGRPTPEVSNPNPFATRFIGDRR